MSARFDRIVFLVLDSVGIGAMPDATKFGDSLDYNTIANCARSVGGLKLPNLQKFGLGNICDIAGVSREANPTASFGKCAELSNGKDTTTGHWEMAGLLTQKPFPTFYNGFPPEFMERFVREANVKGFLGNIPASGTAIIQDLGEEHMRSGLPIVYTSSDSVFQIACHEESFGLERLYEICKVARKICDDYNIARVIARPFLGKSKGAFKRTGNRKDFSVDLTGEVMMQKLMRAGIATTSIGKVASIYSEQGFTKKVKGSNNQEIFAATLKEIHDGTQGLIFANLVDFDMLYGHRRDPQGYAKELEWFDRELPNLISSLGPRDALIMSADHGNDPTAHGTDHTREYVPLLAWSGHTAKVGGAELGIRKSFADIGQTVLDGFGLNERQEIGESFLGFI